MDINSNPGFSNCERYLDKRFSVFQGSWMHINLVGWSFTHIVLFPSSFYTGEDNL